MAVDVFSAMAETELLLDEESVQLEFNQAVIKGDLKAVASLADQVDVDQLNQQGVTPLFVAIENGNVELIQLLVKLGASINNESYCQAEGFFEIPLATAVRTKHRDVVELLVKYRAEMEGVANAEGKSPLQWAATYGDVDMAQLLLENGANVNHLGPYFNSALHYATFDEQEEMVNWLLSNGAKLVENGDNRNVLHTASIRGNCSIITTLLDHGCDFNMTDRYNFSPFSLACLRGHLDVVKLLVEKTSGDVDINDGLLRAAEAGFLTVTEYLVEHGADVNYCNANGETALSVAAARGQYQVVLMLLNFGARINIIDNRKYTPLLLSMMREHVDLVTTLVIHCGNLVLPADMADSPSRMAYSFRHPMLLKLFLLAGLDIVRESWFTEHNLEAELRELDFTVPASRRNIWETKVIKESWSWLRDRVGQPRKLKEVCRIVIRGQLSKATGGRSILRRIDLLPFPTKINGYIKFNDLLLE